MAQDSIDALPRRRWWLKPLLIVAAVALVGAGGFWAYRASEPGRLCKQARVELDKADYRSAAMTLRRALTLSPGHAQAARLMAELTDKLGASTAPAWHEQVVAQNPDSAEERIAWAGSAIRARRMDAAAAALAGAPESFRATADYEALRGMVAIGKGQWREAEQAFAEARRRDPQRPGFQFNHALAQVQSPDAKVREAGMQTLHALAQNPVFGTEAKRAMLRVHTRLKHLPEAVQLSTEIAQAPDAVFPDQLTVLDLIGWQKKEEFPAALERAKQAAAKTPQDIGALLFWASKRNMAREIRQWAEGLDRAKLEDPQAIENYAEAIAATNDWPALAALTAKKLPWVHGETMRNAFAALAAEKSDNQAGAASLWELAVQSAANQRDSAMALAYFAHRAGWRARLLETLWAASAGDDPEWALRMLHRLCAEDGNTAGLLRVARRLQSIRPDDQGAQNNAIILALLLGEPAPPLLDRAAALHAKVPANPVFASTYAFALHRAGKSGEGLQVLEKLPAEELRKPEVAVYYSVLLAANGKADPAKEAAALAVKANLLPEERQLLAPIRPE